MKKILVASPTLTAGSWICIEEYVKPISDQYEVKVVGLGDGKDIEGLDFLKIPYPLFEKMNPKYGGNIIYNALYQLPLQFMTAYYILTKRPNVLVSNGFTPILLALPFIKIFQLPVVVYYGSFLEGVLEKYPFLLGVFRILNSFISNLLVNSRGSLEDAKPFIDEEKIKVIEHWTDIEPVSIEERTSLQEKYGTKGKYIFTFVGRLVEDKGVKKLLDLIEILKERDVPNLEVWFVGNGLLQPEVEASAEKNDFVKYKGFVTDRVKLRELFGVSDLLWTFADITYVAKPGIESLAVGTPLMIPNTAAIIERYEQNIKIDPELIPTSVGWIVNDNDLESVADLLERIVKEDITNDEMRLTCQKYADDNHSEKNIQVAINLIADYAKS